jgi:hypothetical protein
MAFTPKTLARLGHANGVTFWIYKTDDLPTDIDSQDYFLAGIKNLNIGDLIYTLADQAGAGSFGFFTVNENDGITIDTGDLSTTEAADTD